MAVVVCGAMVCIAMAQAIPEKIYVNRYSSDKRVEVVGGTYVDSMRIKLGNVKLYDSLYFHMTDGTTRAFRVRGIDSITMDEPRDLLLKELDYYNKISNKRIPTYADSYVTIASWTQRSQWNLANVHDPTVMKAADGYYYMYQTNESPFTWNQAIIHTIEIVIDLTYNRSPITHISQLGYLRAAHTREIGIHRVECPLRLIFP